MQCSARTQSRNAEDVKDKSSAKVCKVVSFYYRATDVLFCFTHVPNVE
jgi:hypothetical protein